MYPPKLAPFLATVCPTAQSEGCLVSATPAAEEGEEGTSAAAKPVVRPGFAPEEAVQAPLQALVR
jgi:hypothetical protein